MNAGRDSDGRQRGSMRLSGHDYAEPGSYFVTICTQNRDLVFGDFADGEVRLSGFGRTANAAWEEIPAHFAGVEVDEYVVMPNHVHGIIVIVLSTPGPTPRATRASPLRGAAGPGKGSIGAIVGSYKSAVSRGINQTRGKGGVSVWQRSYYEHIIRDEADLNRIRQYIWDNPARWDQDPENPHVAGGTT